MIRGTWSLTEPLVPVSVPATVFRFGISKGANEDDLLKGTGLSRKILADPDARLSYQQVMILTHNVKNHSPLSELGLELGAAIQINQFGMLGYAILSCADLRSALALGLKYHSLVDPAFDFEVVDIEEDGRTLTSVRMTSHIPDAQLYRIMCDVFLVNFASMARFLTGNAQLQPLAVHLNHPKPDYADNYARYFDCDVCFDQPRTALLCERSLLDLPVAMADEATAAMAEQQCEDILTRMGSLEGLVAKVRRILLSKPGSFPNADAVASQLATSTRTLSRSLRALGTSYQRIFDEVRTEMAIEYLRSSQLPVDEIAMLVGFSDPSNFRKAFRRWTGHAPMFYRQ